MVAELYELVKADLVSLGERMLKRFNPLEGRLSALTNAVHQVTGAVRGARTCRVLQMLKGLRPSGLKDWTSEEEEEEEEQAE